MTARVPMIACVAVLAFFAGITGIRLAYTLAYVLVLLLVVAYIWSRLLARKLRVTRESPQGSFMMGEPFEETFTVKNESGLRLPYCEVRDGTKLPGYTPGRAFALAAGARSAGRRAAYSTSAASITSVRSKHVSAIPSGSSRDASAWRRRTRSSSTRRSTRSCQMSRSGAATASRRRIAASRSTSRPTSRPFATTPRPTASAASTGRRPRAPGG